MVADSDKQTFQRIAYALYARFSALWQSRAFLFPTAAIAGVPNVGKSINPKGIDLSRANILVIRSDALGDSILTLPFLRALKRQLPRARVTLAVAKPWKVFFESLHVVDEVIDYPFSADKWKATSRVFGALATGFKILRKKQFEVVINPRWDADFHDAFLLAFFSFAPNRIAFFEKATPWKCAANRGLDRFYTHVVSDSGTRHEVARSFQLLKALGLDSIPEDQFLGLISIADRFPPATLDLDPAWAGCQLIGIFPGVQDSAKQWRLDHFVECAKRLLERKPVRFLALGTGREARHCQEFCQALPGVSLNLSGRTELPRLAGILRCCSAVVSCDSGGAHLAGALDVPVVVLFSHRPGADPDSSISPERFQPLGEKVVVLQPPPAPAELTPQTGESPVNLIPPRQVAQAVLSLI